MISAACIVLLTSLAHAHEDERLEPAAPPTPTPMRLLEVQSRVCEEIATTTSCFGVVQVCNEGYYEWTGQGREEFVTCRRHVCGVCIGFSW